MTSKEIIEVLTADVERLMKLHEGAMAEVASLREKSSEQKFAPCKSSSAKQRQRPKRLRCTPPLQAACRTKPQLVPMSTVYCGRLTSVSRWCRIEYNN